MDDLRVTARAVHADLRLSFEDDDFAAGERLAREDMGLRPLEFATGISQQVEIVFTEDNVTAFFELIGEQMSSSAEAQW